MATGTFKLSHIVTDIFRNGTSDNISRNPEILGFVIGAIDNGFNVSLNGFMPKAKRGKVEVFLRFNRDDNNLNLVIFNGKEKVASFSYGTGGFVWMDADVYKGNFYHNKILITSFK